MFDQIQHAAIVTASSLAIFIGVGAATAAPVTVVSPSVRATVPPSFRPIGQPTTQFVQTPITPNYRPGSKSVVPINPPNITNPRIWPPIGSDPRTWSPYPLYPSYPPNSWNYYYPYVWPSPYWSPYYPGYSTYPGFGSTNPYLPGQ